MEWPAGEDTESDKSSESPPEGYIGGDSVTDVETPETETAKTTKVGRVEDAASCHPMAPRGAHIFMKYGEQYYSEDAVPENFTVRDDKDNVCRFVSSFLVYNRKGERLARLERTFPGGQHVCLYGALLPFACISNPEQGRVVRQNLKRRKHRRVPFPSHLTPFPVKLDIVGYNFDYGKYPTSHPHIWVKSVSDHWYRYS
eukprot:Gregarina_sp_Poly_1__3014@NODE_1847_length_3213_cov_87_893516_g1199_i0_p2_GENE_NODE_1847_length_3213_cov_87_893516_g1199_i0NODE_1847_length_3213_cov_87_893516_g1199_i0_p2_ORF_typecomplete_len199_score16_32_NODE_1847_length_3213_cov_87_893516_g1199_i0153749